MIAAVAPAVTAITTTITTATSTLRSKQSEKHKRVRAHVDAAIDIHWRFLQEKDAWFVLWPVGGEQSKSYSDIEKRAVDYSTIPLSSHHDHL